MIDSADLAEITIGLGANEVLGGDRDGIACPRLRLSSVDNIQRCHGVNEELSFHVWSLISAFRHPAQAEKR